MHIILWIVVILVILGLIISLAEWVVEHIVQILLVAAYVVGLIFFPKVVIILTLICVALFIVGMILKGIGEWIERNLIHNHLRKDRRPKAKGKKTKNKYVNVAIDESLPDDIKLVLAEGNKYITRIRNYNEEIEDKDVSDKLDKLEGLMRQIFTELGRCPEKSKDMDKLKNYYLPTIDKLVKSYSELDKYEFQSANILEMKTEISKSLDDANEALSELMNDLFLYDKIEVQSDISVMKNMFERDGIYKN